MFPRNPRKIGQIVVDTFAPVVTASTILGIVPIDSTTAPETRARLQHHKMVLESFGVDSLSSLGKLSISGNVVPEIGLLKPADDIYETDPVIFQSAARFIEQDTAFQTIGGEARLLKAIPFSTVQPLNRTLFKTVVAASRLSGTVDISDAYWAATWIDIADNTVIVFKQPNMYLTIITEKLTVGKNVTFTWEKSTPKSLPTKIPKLIKKSAAVSVNDIWGVTGEAGQPGNDEGGKGPNGKDGPELELWTLEMTGSPKFDLKGQDGFQGGEGQDGQDGQDGSNGREAQGYWLVAYICESGPGNGGDGGAGGAAGNGGPGGNGGHGGRLTLYAPQPVLNAYAQGFYASVDGGAAASGGIPGAPGRGGDGGQLGDNPQKCSTSNSAGKAGSQGAAGKQGPAGKPGEAYLDDAFGLKAIDADDFIGKLLEPAIINLSPLDVKEGDSVTATGRRYTATDVAFVEGVACATTVISDTQLTFNVPAVPGGRRAVQISQTDGTLSNRATLNVLPVISVTQPAGRIRPGTSVTLIGSGFAPGTIVRVNEQDMPNARFIDANTLEFTLIRPSSVAPNPAGENVTLKVVLAAGTPSNEIPLVLDTYRLLVLGDSVAWGQGLQESEKFYSLVETKIRQVEGSIGVYKQVLAHSGAVIGFDDNDIEDTMAMLALDGEVPTSYPTILQQCDTFTDAPDTVDLVLLNGGINDTNVRRILNPFNPTAMIKNLAEVHCHRHMLTLLERVTAKFPNAKVIVTGYYPLISEDSDLAALTAFLVAAGVWAGGLIGGVAIGAIGAVEKEKIVANCYTFAEQSRTKLQTAVRERNKALGGSPRVFFADAGFSSPNAALASDPWIYGIRLDLSPEDNLVAGPRGVVCVAAGSSRTDVEICKRASMGHPNAKGAQAYATAVIQALQEKPASGFNYQFDAGSAPDLNKDGIWFRDAEQRYALFRGVNFAGRSKLPPYLPIMPLDVNVLDQNGIDQFHAELAAIQPELDRMKQLGFNIIRLPVMWKAIEPTPNPNLQQLLPTGHQYLSLIKEIIDALYARGIFVIIDFHQDIAHEVFGGDGFPDWAMAIDATHPRPKQVKLDNAAWGLLYYDNPTPGYTLDEMVRATLRSFWQNDLTNTDAGLSNFPVRTHLEKTIGQTAAFFGNHPAILGYEPFNEPHPVGFSKQAFEGQTLPLYYGNVLMEINQFNSRAFLFPEPRMDWTTYDANGPEFDLTNFTHTPGTFLDTTVLGAVLDRLVFSFHHYDPWLLTPIFAQNMHDKVKEWPPTFQVMRDAAASRNMIPFLTEFGGSQDWQSSTDLRPEIYQNHVIRAAMDLLFQQVEGQLLNSTYWNYDLYNTDSGKDNWNRENFSLRGPDRSDRNLDIVTRPYPVRSSAQPSLLFFDLETKNCAIILSGTVVDAPTIIYVPRDIHYPNGFEVRATSGSIQWDAGNQLLYWLPDKAQVLNQIVIGPVDGFDLSILPAASKTLLPNSLFKAVIA